MFEIQQAAQCSCIGMKEQERVEGGGVREITGGLKCRGLKAESSQGASHPKAYQTSSITLIVLNMLHPSLAMIQFFRFLSIA